MLLRKTNPMNDSIDDPAPDNAKLIKMEDGSRSSVQFKPSKRMKKRRQLDALVGNDKKLSRRKHSSHELLRSNDSGSSEVEEFSIFHGPKQDKSWNSSNCCFTCYTLTCVLLVTSCLLACATLIWMHLELKRDFNDLRDRLKLVENKNAGTPEEFQALQTKLNSIEKSVKEIRMGKYGLQSLNKSIVVMQKQIASLAATQQEQKQSIQTSHADDKDQKAVTDTVVALGSGLQSTQADVKLLKASQKTFNTELDDLSNRVSVLEKPHGREGGIPQSDTERLQIMLTKINSTYTQFMAKALDDLNTQQSHIEALSQFTQSLQKEVNSVSQLFLSLNQSQYHLQESLSLHESSTPDEGGVAQLQDQVNQLQQTLEQMQSGQSNVTKADSSMELSLPGTAGSQLQVLMKDHEEFLLFRSEVYHDINVLNASVVSINGTVGALRMEVGDLFTKVNLAIGSISNMTTTVGNIVNLMASHDVTAVDMTENSHPGEHIENGDSSTTKTPIPANGSGDEVHTNTQAPTDREDTRHSAR